MLQFLNLFRRPRCATCGDKMPRRMPRGRYLIFKKGWLRRICYTCWLEQTKGFTD